MSKNINGDSLKKRMHQIAAAWKSQGRSYEAMLLTGVVDSLVYTEPAVPSSHQWISTKERLPDDNICVLALVSGQPEEHVFLENAYQVAEYFPDNDWLIEGFPDWENPTVTWWMPLPEQPDE